MNKDTALQSIRLAGIMLEKASRYIDAFDEDEEARRKWLSDKTYQKKELSIVKTSDALKRASMDLTRALADMRRPG